jgi:hypothetical protein
MTGSEQAFASLDQHFRLLSENLRRRAVAFAKRGLTGCLIGGGCRIVEADLAQMRRRRATSGILAINAKILYLLRYHISIPIAF